MKNIVSLACLAGTLIALPAVADELQEGNWDVGIGVAFLNSTDASFDGGTKAKFGSDEGFRLTADYSYTDALQFGASFGMGSRNYEANVVGDQPGESFSAKGDLDYSTLLATATYNFLDGPFRPFVTAGLGWSWVDTNIATQPPTVGCWWHPWYGYICSAWVNTKTLDGFTYGVGVGARYDFGSNVSVRASYRIDWIDFKEAKSTPDFDGFELSVGWKF